jgi:hypothetical protein
VLDVLVLKVRALSFAWVSWCLVFG